MKRQFKDPLTNKKFTAIFGTTPSSQVGRLTERVGMILVPIWVKSTPDQWLVVKGVTDA